MLVLIGWVTLFFVQFILVDCRYLKEGLQVNPDLLTDTKEEMAPDDLYDEPLFADAQAFDRTEETGDELFLKVRPKTVDLAPSESDYEDEVNNSEEDLR
uniref:Calsyntenin-1-like n=1 Tax=Caenorhabditis tropicalis TaxID=1561998 RepID=A0A1I7T0S5_9PELO